MRKSFWVKQHCCDMMREQVEYRCEMHPDPYDCPDNIVIYWPTHDRYGLIVHDGGESVLVISYCPWCGQNIESSRKIKRQLRLGVRYSKFAQLDTEAE